MGGRGANVDADALEREHFQAFNVLQDGVRAYGGKLGVLMVFVEIVHAAFSLLIQQGNDAMEFVPPIRAVRGKRRRTGRHLCRSAFC